MNGTVKNVHVDKGFGFITGENGTEYFFHSSSIKNGKIGDVKRGQSVSFEDNEGSKGPRAEDVFLESN